MRRYWCSIPVLSASKKVLLSGDLFHHIHRVCRHQQGDRLELLQNGKAYQALVLDVEKKTSCILVEGYRNLSLLGRPYIYLALSLPKLATLEAILPRAVELGVYGILPFFSDFSFIKAPNLSWKKKAVRFQRIIEGSLSQSGRAQELRLQDPVYLKDLLELLKSKPQAFGIWCDEAGSASLKQEIAKLPSAAEEIWIFIGGEGGFSNADRECFNAFGLSGVTFGDQILRVETACSATVAMLKYRFDLWGPLGVS